MSGPNVFNLEPEFAAIADFADEDNPEGVKSLIDDPTMIRDHFVTLEPLSSFDVNPAALLPEHRAELEAFVLRVAKAGKMLQRDIETLEDARADVQRRINMREQRLQNLRGYLAWIMKAWGLERAKDTRLSLWTAASPPSVVVEDPSKVPADFKRITSTIEYGAIPGDVLEFLLSFVDMPEGDTVGKASVEVEKKPIVDQFRRTGEVPDGVSIDATRKHVVWRG